MIYAVIMAGGKGVRLWPQSREHKPKQLWELLNGRSMLQDAVDRVVPLIEPQHVLVITGEPFYCQIRDQLSQIPSRHIILEPMGRSTAPCVGLAALYINDPDACMVVLPSDHVIRNNQEFQRALQIAVDMASQGENLVTFGIKPTRPDTGFGYIQRGEAVQPEVYKVLQFTEKPDLATAERFMVSGQYYWNSGMFVWKVSTLMTMIERYLPKLYQGLLTIRSAMGSLEEQDVITAVFNEFDPISIDYGIMENAENTYVVPGDFGWNDVGSWAALADVGEADQDGNSCRGQVVTLDSYGNIVYDSDGLTALIGVKDLIVVRVRDAVLVCPKDRAQQVRELVDKLETQGMTAYL